MVRFCLIGVGRAGLVHARNLCHRITSGTLVALCDTNETTMAEAATELGVSLCFTDYREACATDVFDAVIIVTPTHLHEPIAREAAARGKHIFLEKPMAVSVAECRQINEAARQAGVTLQIGFMRRFDEGYRRAYSLLASGEMGRVMVIKSTGRGPGLPPPWIYDIEKSNGILAEVNSHDFDSIRWLAGSDIAEVFAMAGNFKCPDAKEAWPLFYDNAVVNLRFENGTLGMVDGTCPCGYGYDARVEVLCENGLLQIGSVAETGVTEVHLNGAVESRAVRSWRTLFKDAYIAELEHFIHSVVHGTPPLVSGEDGLHAVAAVVAANRSIIDRTPVQVKE
jgi:myo-inositol 2-dehydrogenase/D-chiro-inositol 1-dehydrogenase/scyllo-inositol 2-dehydrogenase (NAD+)